MTEPRSPAFDRVQHRRNGNSADLLRNQGKHEQAASLLRRNLAMSAKHFSEHHSTVLGDRDSLSDCLRELGDYEGAINLDKVTLPIRQRLEKEGEDTIATLQSLADNLSQIGKHEQAIPLHWSALAARIKTLGGKHKDTLETQHNLASSLYESDQAQKASELNAQVLKVREERLAADDHNLIATRHNLAANHYALGNLEQAVGLTNQNLLALQNTRTSNDAQLLAICRLQDRIKSTIQREAKRALAIRMSKQAQSAAAEEPERVSDNQVETRAEASEFQAGLNASQRKPKEVSKVEPAAKVGINARRDGNQDRKVKSLIAEGDVVKRHSSQKAEVLNQQPGTLGNCKKEDAKAGAGSISTPRSVPKPSPSCPEETKGMTTNAKQSQDGNVTFHGRSFSDPRFEIDRPRILHTTSEKKQRIASNPLSASLSSNAGTKVRPRSSHEQMASRLEPRTVSTPTADKPRSKSVGTLSKELNTIQPKLQTFSDMGNTRSVAQSRKAQGPRVRLAILDTGIDLSHAHFASSPEDIGAVQQQQSGPRRHRVKECKSFVGEAAGDRDSVGHGTHCAALLLELSPNADIYVARVCEEGTNKLNTEAVAKAIMHAADQWKVAIITLSFGWPQYHQAVADAIDHATMHSVLICAAASNGGANDDVAFPANFEPVICVHSTNEQGKPSNFTPNPHQTVTNFAVLGENVRSAWPAREHGKSQSGTSTATPILAAVMALILEFVDQKPRKTPDEKRLLRRDHRVMRKVLLAMSDEVEGYRYVRPWKLMSSNVDRGRVESRIQDAIGS
ncbi:MAG: hypothetical protein Q9166_002861 [cf. Caloplaca sp. 2 TL-2023]